MTAKYRKFDGAAELAAFDAEGKISAVPATELAQESDAYVSHSEEELAELLLSVAEADGYVDAAIERTFTPEQQDAIVLQHSEELRWSLHQLTAMVMDAQRDGEDPEDIMRKVGGLYRNAQRHMKQPVRRAPEGQQNPRQYKAPSAAGRKLGRIYRDSSDAYDAALWAMAEAEVELHDAKIIAITVQDLQERHTSSVHNAFERIRKENRY